MRRSAALLPAVVLLCAALSPAPAAAAEPGAATVVPVQVTGPPAKRFNLIVMGDGYTEADQAKFRADVDRHLNVMWSIEPFKSYRNYVNVYRIDIVSGESGVSCDPGLDAPRRTTPLSMGFWGRCNPASVQRLITMDNAAATRYADLVTGATSGNRQILALANSGTYGGAGGSYATASGSNSMSALISPHELGHSLGGLQDEYDYYQRGVPGGAYTGPEPASAHHTLLTEQQLRDQRRKWWRWLGEPSESGGPIGRYEGGLYYTSGVWRPSAHSMMKTLGYYYDQVAREVMTQRITAKTAVVQDATPAGAPVGADRVLWVEPMRPVSHSLTTTWSVDGRVLPGDRDALDLRTLGLAPGTHTVTATVADPTGFVRDPAIRAALTGTRTWSVDTALTTPPDGTEPAVVSSTPTDRPLGRADVVHVETTHPAAEIPRITWTLDGKETEGGTELDLGALGLAAGGHTLTASLGGRTLTWQVDAEPPVTAYELSQPLARAGDTYVYNGPFTMRLTGADDRAGHVVAESRVDGDGWFNYFGWPTSSELPWTFSEQGTVIDSLVYGKLPRGRHTVEYRSIDAAGNTGAARSFTVTTIAPPPACTRTLTGEHRGPLAAAAGVTCLDHAQVTGPVTVRPGASLVATGGRVTGALAAADPAAVHLLGARVEGALTVSGAGELVVVGAEVRGAALLTGNTAPVLSGTTVRGALACSGNTAAPADLGVPNDLAGAGAGQCGRLSHGVQGGAYEAVQHLGQ
ncbi:M64 family metallopeptidase [Actinomadura sp. ATCC 31491]|uniref:M64 family metallopeptidase n=1 Tax=Actinomadura luzonensis TaxID=2805427 RepID=A0ABT0G2Z2_9ACTN|nr:M64 family metallopeptidase [Actinomadura luzonensis]MCK2218950.1 M64 family metallopeptidase [Actinomadura luzonensis]